MGVNFDRHVAISWTGISFFASRYGSPRRDNYPVDKQEEAITLVLEQAETLRCLNGSSRVARAALARNEE
jgi:hypothetical protein